MTEADPTPLTTAALLREAENLRREIAWLERHVADLRQADREAVATALAAVDRRGKGIGEVLGWVIGVAGLLIAIAAIFFEHH